MKLIVGLGNPGREYDMTPHNMGFMAMERLASECGKEISRRESQALTAHAELEGQPVILAKPQTFMNLSGPSVAKLLQSHELTAADLIVVVDEIEVPLGMLRVRPRGSAGGHNGLKSIIGSLGSNEFCRVRIGVRPDWQVEDYAAFVLKPFRRADAKVVTEAVDLASEAVRVVIREGVQKAMNRFNRRVPPPES